MYGKSSLHAHHKNAPYFLSRNKKNSEFMCVTCVVSERANKWKGGLNEKKLFGSIRT